MPEYLIDDNPYPNGARSECVKVGQAHHDDYAVEVGVPRGHLYVSPPLPYRIDFIFDFLMNFLLQPQRDKHQIFFIYIDKGWIKVVQYFQECLF